MRELPVNEFKQTYFDKRTFDLFTVNKTDCSAVLKQLDLPEIQIQTGDTTKMIYLFEVPMILFNYETTTGSDTVTVKSEGIYDYSQYRKMTFIFDKNCLLKKRDYYATLTG